jgi:hypothetical protein
VPTRTEPIDGLDQLIADARRLPAAVLPRPRTASPEPERTIDLTAREVHIPETTVSLIDGYDAYGA